VDLPTYTNIWRIEKRLYKLYDFRLPAPLPITWIAVFTGITVPYIVFLVAVGLPFNHNLVWLYVLPPGVLTWLTTRPVIESKRLPELIGSQLRYLAEPRVWRRMAPSTEKDEILVSVRVWHRYPPKARSKATRAAKRAQRKERHVAPPHVRPSTAVNRPEEGWRVAAQRPIPQRVAATSGAAHALAPSAPPARPQDPASRPPVPQWPTPVSPAQFAPGPQPHAQAQAQALAHAQAQAQAQAQAPSWFEPSRRIPPGPRQTPANVAPRPPQPPAQPPAPAAGAAPEPAKRPAEQGSTSQAAATAVPSKPAEPPKRLTLPLVAAWESRPAPPAEPAPARQPVIGGWKPRPAPIMPSAPAEEEAPPAPPAVLDAEPPAAPEPPTAPERVAQREPAAGLETQTATGSVPALARALEVSHDVADHWYAPDGGLPEATASPAHPSFGQNGPVHRSHPLTAPVPAASQPTAAQPATVQPAIAQAPQAPPPVAEPPAAQRDSAAPLTQAPAQQAQVQQAQVQAQQKPNRPAARILDLDEERPVPSIERALSAPNARRDLSWRRRVKVVAGGQGPGKRDQETLDRERARLPLSTHKNIVVLGCHGGAGQSTTAVMTARLLATLRGHPVAALDLSDGRKPGTRTSGGNLDIIAAEGNPDYDDLAQHYPLLVIDPAPSGLTRVLDITDQLLIVAPPDPEAATHLASTQQWLEAHDHADLAAGAVTVINGVTRESMADVVRAESVARGRCRAIVRVPWDNQLSTKHPQVPRTPQTRLAYTALSGVIIAGLAAAPLSAGVPRSKEAR
jgi:MinD-like ATPase involved in chromosome partitioning or flagellar assembly